MSTAMRRLVMCVACAAATMVGAAGAPSSVDGASCVRISGGRFDAPGNDNYAANLNGEYVRIRNYCTTPRYLTGWKLHDYGRKHTYVFRRGFRVGAGVTVTIYTGRGTNTSSRLYWQRTYGAVWDNAPPERAYLRTASGTLVSSWSPF